MQALLLALSLVFSNQALANEPRPVLGSYVFTGEVRPVEIQTTVRVAWNSPVGSREVIVLNQQGYSCVEAEQDKFTCAHTAPTSAGDSVEMANIVRAIGQSQISFPAANLRPTFAGARGAAHEWLMRASVQWNQSTYSSYRYIVERNRDRILFGLTTELMEMRVLANGDLGLVHQAPTKTLPCGDRNETRTYLAIFRLR